MKFHFRKCFDIVFIWGRFVYKPSPLLSKQLNISDCCIQNAINKYKQLGTYEDLKRSGRRKKPNGRCFRHLKRLIKGDACLSAMNITSDLNISLPKSVTIGTGRTYLKELGFEYLVKVKKQ